MMDASTLDSFFFFAFAGPWVFAWAAGMMVLFLAVFVSVFVLVSRVNENAWSCDFKQKYVSNP